MRFSIVTPTHKRADKLARTVASVQAQSYQDWEMIIVNDSPEDESYKPFAVSIDDPRIHYYVNQTNSGVNFTRNVALENLSPDSEWVVFLDDDDYLASDALQAIHDLINDHPTVSWFLTNRANKDGTPVTRVKRSDRTYSYIQDCLLLRRVQGDATHTIKTDILRTVRFSKYVKQAEEWIFYYELALKERMFYHSHNSTITDGYDTINGLNFRKRKTAQQLHDVYLLIKDGLSRGFAFRITFWMYICLRIIRAFVKST